MRSQKRPDRTLSAYLNGILALASVCSAGTGRSDVTVSVYAAAGFPDAFRADFRLRSAPVPNDAAQTFSEALGAWLGPGDRNLTERVVALFERELGPAQRVFRAGNEDALLRDLSSSERGFGAFYTTEDAFFVAFSEYTAAFLMGNFE